MFLFLGNVEAKSGRPVKIKILDISETGRVLKLDCGYFDGVRQGDKGDFYLFFDDSGIVGEGEAIKVFGGYSYWHVFRNILGGEENRGDYIYYFPHVEHQKSFTSHRIDVDSEMKSVEFNYLDL